MVKNRIQSDIKTLDVNDDLGVTANERTEISLSWFNVAKDNLDTAKILFEYKKYHHCVYFLQQSIECIVKGVLIENHIIDELQIKTHSPEDAFDCFYKHVNSSSIAITQYVRDRMSGIDSFELRLERMAQIMNYYTDQYNRGTILSPDYVRTFNNSSLSSLGLSIGMDEDAIVQKIQKIYFVNLLVYCIATLFRESQQNTRYPMKSNDKLLLPSERYPGSELIFTGLQNLLVFYDYILENILGS